MAIYHLSAKVISGGKGKSATAAAAYRAGQKIADKRTELTFDYSHKKGVYATEIIAPDHAPDWVGVRSQLWNSVEDAGLSVYRRRRKERRFMKVYSEPLNELLPKISPSAFKVFAALAKKTVRESLNELKKLGVMKRIGPPNRRKYVLNEMYVKRGR